MAQRLLYGVTSHEYVQRRSGQIHIDILTAAPYGRAAYANFISRRDSFSRPSSLMKYKRSVSRTLTEADHCIKTSALICSV